MHLPIYGIPITLNESRNMNASPTLNIPELNQYRK